MTDRTTYIDVAEAVGIFDRVETMQAAMYDLLLAGVSGYDISVLGSREAIGEKLGKSFWQAEELADDPDALRASFVSEEAIGKR